jgi:hypothetical protein
VSLSHSAILIRKIEPCGTGLVEFALLSLLISVALRFLRALYSPSKDAAGGQMSDSSDSCQASDQIVRKNSISSFPSHFDARSLLRSSLHFCGKVLQSLPNLAVCEDRDQRLPTACLHFLHSEWRERCRNLPLWLPAHLWSGHDAHTTGCLSLANRPGHH